MGATGEYVAHVDGARVAIVAAGRAVATAGGVAAQVRGARVAVVAAVGQLDTASAALAMAARSVSEYSDSLLGPSG